jgi:hypothetical protein
MITVTCKCGHKQKIDDYPSRWKCSKCGGWQNYDPVIDNPTRHLAVCQRAMQIRLEWSDGDWHNWLVENFEYDDMIHVLVNNDSMILAYAIAEFELTEATQDEH